MAETDLRSVELCWVDLETGGLEPDRHAILEVAFVRTDLRSDVLGRFGSRVRPLPGYEIEDKALEVSGITRVDAVARCHPRMIDVWPELERLAKGAMLAGHNVGFDRGFLRYAERRLGGELAWGSHHAIDTMSLSIPRLVSGEVKSLSLSALVAFFGIVLQTGQPGDLAVRTDRHSAMGDVLLSIELYRRLQGIA